MLLIKSFVRLTNRSHITLLLFIIFSATTIITAQQASVSWYLSSNQKVSQTIGPLIGYDQVLSNMEVNKYAIIPGRDDASQQTTITGGGWPVEYSQNNDRYIQFGVSVKPGITFNIDSVTMYYAGRGGHNMKLNIAYSADSNFVTYTQLNPKNQPVAISDNDQPLVPLKYSIKTTVNYGQIFYLRIYPWYVYSQAIFTKYVCIQDVVISGTTSGTVIPVLPIISTDPVTDISLTTAVCGGSVSLDGDAEVTERGVCWNSEGNPTISDSRTIDGSGLGTFNSLITGLSSNTKYYFRAYATNSVGTNYGETDSLITLSEISLPTITAATDVKVIGTSASFKCNITDWGGAEITERGICYNTSGNPTINDNKIIEGNGSGEFTAVLFKLPVNKKYYARAYAVNSKGTGYSQELVFDILPVLNGAYADGIHFDTGIIQAAIDSITNSGGGVVLLQNGIYYTAPFELKSNVTLEIDSTATILASQNKYDYYPIGFDTTGGETPSSMRPLISSNHADNITITGFGTIDGNGQPWWDEFRSAPEGTTVRRPWLIILKYANHLLIENITLTNSPMFHLAPQWCRDVLINNIKIFAPENAPNTDGIDPATCHDVIITNCLIDTGDDNVAIKSGNPDPSNPNAASSNITIADCTFINGHGVSIGSETNGGVDSMLVTNCSFDGTDIGIRIKSYRSRGGNVRGITYKNLTMKNVRYPILFSEYYPEIPSQNDPAQTITDKTPYYHDITVENLTAINCTYGGLIIGLPETPMTNISLKNVHISATTGLRIRNATVDTANTSIIVPSGVPFIREVNGIIKSGNTAVENETIAVSFRLSQNYPNPFNPETVIRYQIPVNSYVTLKVYDVIGKEVVTLVDEFKSAGVYNSTINTQHSSLSSGIYFYQLRAGNYINTKKMLLLK